MRYLLDTDICIYLIKKKPPQVLLRLKSLKISDVGLSSITVAELEYGVAKSSRPEQNRWALTEFLAPLEIIPFDLAAAQQYGLLRGALEKVGKPIGAMDMLIAAHALSTRAAVATNNAAEYRRVPGLRVENWAAGGLSS